MLPGSTERAVTVSGSGTAITRCLQEICSVMLEVCYSLVYVHVEIIVMK